MFSILKVNGEMEKTPVLICDCPKRRRHAIQMYESRLRIERKLKTIVNCIRQKGCVDCKIKNVAFHFDHRNPLEKIDAVCRYRYWACKPLSEFVNEIKKCDCVCIPCHKRRTRERNPAKNPPPKAVVLSKLKELEIARNIGYCQCGCGKLLNENDMEFHHVDPSTKIAAVSSLRKRPRMHEEEIKKCIVITSKCHKEITTKVYVDRFLTALTLSNYPA